MTTEIRDERRESFWRWYDFSQGHGLEIGPLHRTLVPRDSADVRYVDVQDRDTLLAHYADDPAVDPDLVPEIDYHLIQDDGRTLSLAEATAPGAPYSWVVASHVIEHVPDLIGWLDELASIVDEGGTLVLAVPDRRYSFDLHRPPTTVGQMLQAHLQGEVRPSVRAVYDHFSTAVRGDASDLWTGHLPTYEHRYHSPPEAQEQMHRVQRGEYVDTHVWIFSPHSFLEQMHELRSIGHSRWYVAALEPTPPGDLEFKVSMRRLPAGVDPTGPIDGEVRAQDRAPDWLRSQADLIESLHEQLDEMGAELHLTRLRAIALRNKVGRLQSRIAAVRTRARRRARRDARKIRHLEQRLDDLQRSRQWRLAGAALTPARAARRWLGR